MKAKILPPRNNHSKSRPPALLPNMEVVKRRKLRGESAADPLISITIMKVMMNSRILSGLPPQSRTIIMKTLKVVRLVLAAIGMTYGNQHMVIRMRMKKIITSNAVKVLSTAWYPILELEAQMMAPVKWNLSIGPGRIACPKRCT